MKSHKHDDLTLDSITAVSYSLHVLKNKNQGKTSFEGGSIFCLVLLICCFPSLCEMYFPILCLHRKTGCLLLAQYMSSSGSPKESAESVTYLFFALKVIPSC